MPMIEAGRDMPTYRESLLDGAKLDSDGVTAGYGDYRLQYDFSDDTITRIS